MTLFEPGTSEYESATAPHNSATAQHPAFVAAPRDTDEVASAVREIVGRGLRVVPQATGHGAGAAIGDDDALLDTSALTALQIDTDKRTAVAGAGITWGAVNAEAEKHGLLGLAGSAPSVSVSGYTFGGGIGWLSRPHGLAAGALRRVTYVDGAGNVREAHDDAGDALDRDAIWTFRGGGGVGVATELEFDLFPVPDLYAGYLLWPIENLHAVVTAWAEALPDIADDVATSISVLHTSPGPPFATELQNRPLVHLAIAATNGPAGPAPLLDAVHAAAPPALDTWGRANATALAGIHLDPPAAVSAVGVARWLTDAAPSVAADVLAVNVETSPMVMLELRHVATTAAARDGAQSRAAGPFVVHAVAAYDGPESRPAIAERFEAVRAAAEPADAGLSVGSWVEGSASVPDALPADVRARAVAVADRVDPDGVISRNRILV